MAELKRAYPIYSAKLLTLPDNLKSQKQYLLISGGGGKAATGIHNKLELFDVNSSRVPKIVCQVSTDQVNGQEVVRNNAPMNMAVYHDKFIAVGLGEKTQLYEIEPPSPQNSSNSQTSSVGRIQRRKPATQSADNSTANDYNTNTNQNSEIKIKRVAEVSDTSLNSDEAPVTRVALSSGSHLIAGGSNTTIKVFNYSRSEASSFGSQCQGFDVKLKFEILNSHPKELRDIAIHKNLIASISEDKNCYIWALSSNSFTKLWSLKEQFLFDHKIGNKISYKFTSVSWFDSGLENKPVYLITCHSPVNSRTTSPSYICIWRHCPEAGPEDEKFKLMNSKSLYNEVGISKTANRSIFVDPARRIVGLGFETGHVLVYSVPDFSPIFRYEPKNLRQASVVTNVVISRNFVIATSTDMCIRVYDFKNNYSQFWAANGSFLVFMLVVSLMVGVRIFFIGI